MILIGLSNITLGRINRLSFLFERRYVMNFYIISTMSFGFGVIICCILLYVNKQKYLKKIGDKEITIIRLTKENNKLNRIFDNYKFYKSFDYNKIQYISSEKRIVFSNGRIKTKEQYTTDITKAKNFAKYKNDYIEINKEDN